MANPIATNALRDADKSVALEYLRKSSYGRLQAELWLTSPHELLAGEKPIDLLGTSRAKEVFVVIGELNG